MSSPSPSPGSDQDEEPSGSGPRESLTSGLDVQEVEVPGTANALEFFFGEH